VRLVGQSRSGVVHVLFVHCPYRQSLPVLHAVSSRVLDR
jgi:hypothetical protein